MPAPVLRTDVVAFITQLRDNPTKAVPITQAEIDQLQARLQPSTLKTYLSWRRTAVLEAFGAGHPAYDMLRLTDEQYAELNQKYQADVSLRQRHPIRLKHARQMIELAVKLITGRPIADQVEDAAGDADLEEAAIATPGQASAPMGNVRNLILGLCLLTGRRAYEIAANPETRFQPIYLVTPKGKVRERFQLEFRGQAKTKGAEQSMSHKLNTIPVLADAGLILDAFERLRELIPGTLGMDYDTFNRAYAKPLSRRCKQLFGPYWPNAAVILDEREGQKARGKPKVATPEISVKDLRTIYAEVCSIVFNLTGTIDEKMKPSEYMARILGHRENDLATAQSYSAIVVEDIVAPGNHPRISAQATRGHAPAADNPNAPSMRSSGKGDADLVESDAQGRPDIKGLPNAIAGAARRIETSHDPVELFASLALLTGLPPRDLVDPEVTFQHRTTRAGAGTVRDKTAILAAGPEGEFVIPVLAGTELVLDAVTRLRAAIAKGKAIDPDEIDAQWRPALDRYAKTKFSKIAPSIDRLRAAHGVYLGIEEPKDDNAARLDSSVVDAETKSAAANSPKAEKPKATRKNAADIAVDQLVSQLDLAELGKTVTLSVQRRPAGDELLLQFHNHPGKAAPIAILSKDTILSETLGIDLVKAWDAKGRKPLSLDQAAEVIKMTKHPTGAPRKAAARQKGEQHQVEGAGTAKASAAAPPIDQLLAGLRPEHLGRSARLEQRGQQLVAIFQERPEEPAAIAKLPAGLTLSDTQIGDVFHAWTQGGRKLLPAAATRKAVES